MEEPQYDVMISYSILDLEIAEALNEALLKQSIDGRPVKVWFDRRSMDAFDDVLDQVDVGIKNSRVVVALVSENLIASPACRYEALRKLTTHGSDSYLAVGISRDLPQRWAAILQKHALSWVEAEATAEDIVEQIKRMGPVAERPTVPRPHSATRFHGANLDRFQGRFDSLLDIYSEQCSMTNLQKGTLTTRRTVAIVGLGGMGKSALALKYAQEFGSEYPGGVYWFRASGDDVNDVADTSAKRDLVVRGMARQIEERAIEQFASQGVSQSKLPDHLPPLVFLQRALELMASASGRSTEPSLWVIDDLPAGLDDLIPELSSPFDHGLTLVTSRSTLPTAHFRTVSLDALEPTESRRLFRMAIQGLQLGWTLEGNEGAAADELAREVGHFPMALDLLAARMTEGARPSWLLADLRAHATTLIDIPDELLGSLPTQHTANIVATLQGSLIDVVRARPEAMVPLRMLSVTAAEPLVPRKLVEATCAAAGITDAQVDTVLTVLQRAQVLVNDVSGSTADERQLRVHAITRLVAIHLATTHLAPWSDSEADSGDQRSVALAAASWFHDYGNDSRNIRDVEAARWFERALTPLQYCDEGREAHLVKSASLRGVARANFRLPPQDAPGSLGGERVALEFAMERIKEAVAIIDAELEQKPHDDALRLERAKIAALEGIVLDKLLDGGHLDETEDPADVNLRALEAVELQAKTRQERLDRGLLSIFNRDDVPTLRETEIDAARSWINVPGRLIKRAKLIESGLVPASAPRSQSGPLLDRAYEIYADIEARRIQLFPPSHRSAGQVEEIASCTNGRAVVQYIRATYCEREPEARKVAVHAGLGTALNAVRARWSTGNDANASKTVLLLGKFGLATAALAGADMEECTSSLDRRLLEIAALPIAPAVTERPAQPSKSDLGWEGELDLAVGPDAGLEAFLPTSADRGPAISIARRRAATCAVDMAAEQTEVLLAPAGKIAARELAHTGTGLALASLTWLALVAAIGTTNSERPEKLLAEWQEEGPRWWE